MTFLAFAFALYSKTDYPASASEVTQQTFQGKNKVSATWHVDQLPSTNQITSWWSIILWQSTHSISLGLPLFSWSSLRYLQTCSSTVFGVMSGTRRMENFPITWERKQFAKIEEEEEEEEEMKKKKKKKAFWCDRWRRCRLIVFCIMLWPILYLSCVKLRFSENTYLFRDHSFGTRFIKRSFDAWR